MSKFLNLPNIPGLPLIRTCLIFVLCSITCFAQDSVSLIIPTFLGNETRNYYGNQAPEKLDVIWKTNLGGGFTVIPNKTKDTVKMYGAGWTGQPILVQEGTKLFLVQGAYDYNLRKINAETGKVVWMYKYDDVIKSSGSMWVNSNKDENDPDKYVIFQGSRRGFEKDLWDNIIPSYRAISYKTGKELWRYNSVKGGSFSRDVDGTALIVDDTLFIGLETGHFVALNPNPDSIKYRNGIKQPDEYLNLKLYTDKDLNAHHTNVVIESAPSLLRNHIYITSGAGYLYGYNRNTQEIDFSFYTGADMDGSPIITRDSCILISIEKQYITGKGGAMLIDPSKHQDSCVVWFFPTEDSVFTDWRGGIIGSCAINDMYISKNQNSLAAFVGIDGYTYVVENEFTNPDDSTLCPNNTHTHLKPQLVFKYKTGISVSTPIFTENRLITLTYNGLYMFEYDEKCNFKLLEKNINIRGEATPIIHNKRLYVASRDGYFYCIGKK
ncbi:MAG: PQQ-binding-like beta-propeller repeat protein [Bacteroidales bacterium]|nr:PQQ-binding-like beta-propeller repeat protein [Bacteroidales bacterium]